MSRYSRLGVKAVNTRPSRGKVITIAGPLTSTRTEVGFTNPRGLYERMRSLDVRAQALNTDTNLYSKNEPYKQVWTKWYANWRSYFDKAMERHDSLGPDGLSVLFGTDEWAARQAQYEQDFMSLHATYLHERDANGNPLPTNTPPLTPPTNPNAPNGDKKEEDDGLSLWTVLAIAAGIGLVVGGYFYIRAGLRHVKAKKEAAEGLLPYLLKGEFGEQGGMALAKVATARDPFTKGPDCACERDLDIRPASPRAGSKYILSGL